jgi:hypothetical protein
MIHPYGTRVRINENVKRHGGREGRILADNTTGEHVELGVCFGVGARVHSWFLPEEVTILERNLRFVSFPKENQTSSEAL